MSSSISRSTWRMRPCGAPLCPLPARSSRGLEPLRIGAVSCSVLCGSRIRAESQRLHSNCDRDSQGGLEVCSGLDKDSGACVLLQLNSCYKASTFDQSARAPATFTLQGQRMRKLLDTRGTQASSCQQCRAGSSIIMKPKAACLDPVRGVPSRL